MPMEPSKKSPAVEAELTRLFGFDRRNHIKLAQCVPPPIGCGKPVNGFRDPLSAREFAISGLCQECQDSVFGVRKHGTPPPPPHGHDWAAATRKP